MRKATYKQNFQVQCCCNRSKNDNLSGGDKNDKYRLHDTARYVVGIIYEDSGGELGFYDFWDDDLNRIVEKSFYIINRGRSSYPAIPLEADPRILYLYDNVKKRNLGDLFKKDGDHNA